VLPRWPAPAANEPVHGTEVVFAAHRLWLDEPAARRLAGQAACHDLPAAAGVFEAGDPVCSVCADGTDARAVHALLARQREAVHRSLEAHA
jgi:predicted ATP-grasp superfamily ATP-dependent carboligase